MPWHTYLEKNTVVFFFGEVKIVKVTSTLQCRYWLLFVYLQFSNGETTWKWVKYLTFIGAEIIGHGNWIWKIANLQIYLLFKCIQSRLHKDVFTLNEYYMICILGNENRTYSEIYNPICVACVVCIFMSPKNIYPFLSIDHLPNSQDANPVVINLNSLRYPLETRQALSFVGVSWFLVSYH